MKQIITSNMQTELTPKIAEMSEVVAKYMGWETVLSDNTIHYFRKQNNDIVFIEQNKFRFTTILDWGICHEVWEKVREFKVNYLSDCWDWSDKKSAIEKSVLCHNKLETLTALYAAIIFINQLKQQENGNKDI